MTDDICRVDFLHQHLLKISLSTSVHLKAEDNKSALSHNNRSPHQRIPVIRACRWLLHQQYCYSCGCSTIFHGATRTEKWPKHSLLIVGIGFGHRLCLIIPPFIIAVLVDGYGF